MIRATRRFLVGLCLLLTVSCNKRIPQDDFTDILIHIYLSGAYFTAEDVTNALWQDSIPYNRHIVEQHGYSWAQFDSTLSWYGMHPQKYRDIHDEVIARLSEMEKAISDELDPPSELWHERTDRQICGTLDSVPVSILLKGAGKYVIRATIRVYPHDSSFDPGIMLYWWRSDTTNIGVCDTLSAIALRKDGLTRKYTVEKTLLPGNEFTHLKGNWLHYGKNVQDTAWYPCIEIRDISVYHIPQKF
ncbi:MAG: DUF4296 domain-containing protein [Bacteroidales bacterium]|jgi:hypothetical protein|nr:DUF4296 domain-containing protein [Bacteroidales bacterium]